MIVDVSEIKDFRHCKRKWQMGSRNQFHLTATVEPKPFKLGTVFHESLHRLYLGKDIDTVTTYLSSELADTYPDSIPMITSMIKGYNREVMPEDQKFKVLDIEHHFKFSPFELLDEKGQHYLEIMGVDMEALADVKVEGSIDMIALDTTTNEVWGFEHKTAKNFRNDIYLWMDEQPRLYYAAMILWVDAYNRRCHESVAKRNQAMRDEWLKVHAAEKQEQLGMMYSSNPAAHGFHWTPEPVYIPDPPDVKLGGVFINEVRKLIRAFDYKRRALVYPEDDLRNFLVYFLTSCAECHKYVEHPEIPRLPLPDMMSCMNCMFNQVCREMQYRDLNLDDLLVDFKDVVKKRDHDHLEEKEEEGVDVKPTENSGR